jgi:class 3 adenylate cyclase
VKTTGDGLFAAFGRADSAVMAALNAKRTLASESWDDTGRLRVRMGLHTGDAEFREGDYHGRAVNRAARLTTAGHGGQVVISGSTASLLLERLPDGVQLMALGNTASGTLGDPRCSFSLSTPI